jgi:hypothetical protein
MLKHPTLLGLVAVLTVALAVIVLPRVVFVHAAHAEPNAPVASAAQAAALLASSITQSPAPPQPPAEMPPAKTNPLRGYLLTVMNDWPHALAKVPAVPYEDIADSILGATSDAKDAVLLAALGYFEGARYAQYVDDGSCNDPVWLRTKEGNRLSHWGMCDGGNAYTIFQIHPHRKGSKLYDLCNKDVITASRTNAAKCALEIAHRSLARTKTLVDYTGEWGAPGHPKADERLSFARRASAKHPYVYDTPFD